MKRIVIIGASVIFFAACNSNKTKTEQVKTNEEVGVPNNNGGIPDTTNAAPLSVDKKVTVPKDSAK